MTAKRFRVQEHCLRSSYGIEAENWLVTNDNHSVVLNDKAEKKGFESCSHNWGILYDEAKNKVEELSKENKELKSLCKVLITHIDEKSIAFVIDEDVRRVLE